MMPETPQPACTQPPDETGAAASPLPHLQRRLGLLQATALNMVNMVGAGPFITIPLLMSALGGPQALLGWAVAALICIPDGMVWSELGAAMPGSGGSYVYLRDGFGRHTWGRMAAFLFIWQFVFSGPLELASGYIGFGQYMSYIWHGMTPLQMSVVAAAVGGLNIALLYRGISTIGRLAVCLWAGMLLTTGLVIASGAPHFSAARAFDFPPGAFGFSLGFLLGLGAAARIGIYDYLGYYDVCYVAEEVRDPGRVIPRSILLSLLGVAAVYFLMNLSIIGTVSWREFVPASPENRVSNHLVSILMERVWGPGFARLFTGLILVTTYGATFALLLGYSRIPYAAARDGCFFSVFGRLHDKGFPHVALVAIGTLSVAACFVPLQTVIDALITTRILVQFVGQVVALILLRRRAPGIPRPYRMWLYPVPCLLALGGWTFVFATSEPRILLFSLATLVAGVVAFLAWSRRARQWPFLPQPAAGA
jgi:amino acid transporter